MSVLAFALTYTAFTALCLAMNRHSREISGRVWSDRQRYVLRGFGWGGLALSLALAAERSGWALGTIEWFGMLTASALTLVLLLPYYPRVAAGLGLALPATALLAVAIGVAHAAPTTPASLAASAGASNSAAIAAADAKASPPSGTAAEEKPVAPASDKPAAESVPRYTFSWPLSIAPALTPRGGTTRGAEVTLDEGPSEDWQRLQEPGLSAFERDRRAILAMAGAYRVTFDFLEISPFDSKAGPQRPYQSWGTEKIYVDQKDDGVISLVHILEMRVRQADGSISEPIVMKHWRQDWRYQPTTLVEYQGRDHWKLRKIAKSESKGRWSQTVYQVDESPRYASVGRWEHSPNFSTWLSQDTWRPLPRREWSVRKDYDVLTGTNRHTILSNGWLQEENNLKAVTAGEGKLDPGKPYVAREYGVARYQRITGADFAMADKYFRNTRHFWDDVRDTWGQVFAERRSVTLKGPVDQLGLFAPLFEQADALDADDSQGKPDNARVIREALTKMGAMGS